MSTTNTQPPKITSITPLSNHDSKWTSLQQITYTDRHGQTRKWEMATRKTRSTTTGIDAVTIGNVILRPSRPASTILVMQYRPPLDAFTVEWPAGLVDEGESVEDAAVREFREETGFTARVVSVGPTVASDPGLSNANMKLVMVEVELGEVEEWPEQSLDEGESIQRVEVPLAELYERLVEYSGRERVVVAAKLFHFAMGMRFMGENRYGL